MNCNLKIETQRFLNLTWHRWGIQNKYYFSKIKWLRSKIKWHLSRDKCHLLDESHSRVRSSIWSMMS